MAPIRTFGHGTASQEEIVDLLRAAGIEEVVDVRRYPGSRRHPHVATDAMARWLPEAGIAYRHLPSLGGRRKPAADSPNVGLRNDQFRAYGDHMATDEFAEGIADLLESADDHPVAIMCSESVWWRCHRRLVSDHLVLVEERPVEHLFHDGRLTAHDPLETARRDDGHVVYDVGVDRPLSG
ncbi:DUF488 domain-containing protein [Actinomarinicola tropica]|uniref:DUF488 family protein n=1 Tax=Actinomarinicola tropica TaxID=2789776 RepID=A0A5Q2RI96_9ACTN|nr:DUF488 domain-containing protein [Actinomarinicola tropica]QGG96588.1 DUF488 family protein [Actinomarinicola tropica]